MKSTGIRHSLRQSFVHHHQSAPPTSRMRRFQSQRILRSYTTLTFQTQTTPCLSDTNSNCIHARRPKSTQLFISAFPGASPFSTSRDPLSAVTTSLPSYSKSTACTYPAKSAKTSVLLQQSSSGIWTAAIVCGIISSAVIYIFYPVERATEQDSSSPIDQLKVISGENWSRMTGEALPGRPGTLTPEQEEKLKEFWVATLKVFGVLDEQEAKAFTEEGSIAQAPSRSDTGSTKDKKSKKKKSLFSRKKKSDDDKSSTSTHSSAQPIADTEDKYGQTKEFHDALANMSPEVLRATFWSMVKHDHPDALLLRFLRARKWDIERALVMMVSTMRWRATQMHVDDDIMKNGEGAALEDEAANASKKSLGHDFLSQMRMGKSFLHGIDKEGRPICFVRARLHKQGEQSDESLERYTVFLIETARMILHPPIDQAVVFFDMTGFGLANMDYAPVKFMIKCFEANYPESLGVVLIHKAPWVFQGIWKIIRGWLDPVVASKIYFTNSVEDVEEYIPKSHIIKELGGDEDWEYRYIEPIAGENDKIADTETRDKLLAERAKISKEFETATLEWIHEDGDQVKGKRHEIAKTLSKDYWGLDPYVRARSFYDRSGMLTPGGQVHFYASAVNGSKSGETEKPHGIAEAPTKIETAADDVD